MNSEAYEYLGRSVFAIVVAVLLTALAVAAVDVFFRVRHAYRLRHPRRGRIE